MSKNIGMLPAKFYDNKKLEKQGSVSIAICALIEEAKKLKLSTKENLIADLQKEENQEFVKKFEGLMTLILDKDNKAMELWDDAEYGILFVKHAVTIDNELKRFAALSVLRELHEVYCRSHEGFNPRVTSKEVNRPLYTYTEPTMHCPSLTPLMIAQLSGKVDVVKFLNENFPIVQEEDKNAFEADRFYITEEDIYLKSLISSTEHIFDNITLEIVKFYFQKTFSAENFYEIKRNLKLLLAFDNTDKNDRIYRITHYHPKICNYIFENILWPYFDQINSEKIEDQELDLIAKTFINIIIEKEIKAEERRKKDTIYGPDIKYITQNIYRLLSLSDTNNKKVKQIKILIATKMIEKNFSIEEINKAILLPVIQDGSFMLDGITSPGTLTIEYNLHTPTIEAIQALEILLTHTKNESIDLSSLRTIPPHNDIFGILKNAIQNNPAISQIKLYGEELIRCEDFLHDNQHIKDLKLLCNSENQRVADILKASNNITSLEINSYYRLNSQFLPAAIKESPNLKHLNLGATYGILDGTIDAIYKSNITSLELSKKQDITPALILKCIGNNNVDSKLERLTLFNCNLNSSQFEESYDVQNSNLKFLTLRHISLHKDYPLLISIIKSMESNNKLEELILDKVELDLIHKDNTHINAHEEICNAITSMIKNNESLKKLVIDSNVITGSTQKIIDAITTNKSLNSVRLCQTGEWKKQEFNSLIKLINETTTLTNLDLSGNIFSPLQLKTICTALTHNKQIESIHLPNSSSRHGKVNLNKEIGDLLLENNTLKSLSLYENFSHNKMGMEDLLNGLRQNSSITNISFIDNDITNSDNWQVKHEMVQAIRGNPNRKEPLVCSIFGRLDQLWINESAQKNATQVKDEVKDENIMGFVKLFTKDKADDDKFTSRVKAGNNLHLNETKNKIAELIYDKISKSDHTELLKFIKSSDNKAKAKFVSGVMQELSKIDFKGSKFRYKKDAPVLHSIAECFYGLIMYRFDKGESFNKWRDKHTEIIITDNLKFRKSLQEVKLDDILTNIKDLIQESKARV